MSQNLGNYNLSTRNNGNIEIRFYKNDQWNIVVAESGNAIIEAFLDANYYNHINDFVMIFSLAMNDIEKFFRDILDADDIIKNLPETDKIPGDFTEPEKLRFHVNSLLTGYNIVRKTKLKNEDVIPYIKIPYLTI